jgi:hypothetical protein
MKRSRPSPSFFTEVPVSTILSSGLKIQSVLRDKHVHVLQSIYQCSIKDHIYTAVFKSNISCGGWGEGRKLHDNLITWISNLYNYTHVQNWDAMTDVTGGWRKTFFEILPCVMKALSTVNHANVSLKWNFDNQFAVIYHFYSWHVCTAWLLHFSEQVMQEVGAHKWAAGISNWKTEFHDTTFSVSLTFHSFRFRLISWYCKYLIRYM